VWFYGISSKRYALYHFNPETKEIQIVSCMLHGLGHITNPFQDIPKDKWHAEIWRDILKLHYGLITLDDIYAKYGQIKEVMKIAISTARMFHRFDEYNEGKTQSETMKPFGFCNYFPQSRNYKTGNQMKLIAPYSDNPQSTTEFINYKNHGEIIPIEQAPLKTLLETFMKYITHRESKFDGKEGVLTRKHIVADKITFIGKEMYSTSEDEERLEPTQPQEFINIQKISREFLKLPIKERKKIDKSDRALEKWQPGSEKPGNSTRTQK